MEVAQSLLLGRLAAVLLAPWGSGTSSSDNRGTLCTARPRHTLCSRQCSDRNALQVPWLPLEELVQGSALSLYSVRFLHKGTLACESGTRSGSLEVSSALKECGRPGATWHPALVLAFQKAAANCINGARTQSTVSFLLHKLERTNLVISSAVLTGACLQGVIMQA